MPWIDPDKTPILLPTIGDASAERASEWRLTSLFEASEAEVDEALERFTPSFPLPLLRRHATVQRDPHGDVLWPLSFRPEPEPIWVEPDPSSRGVSPSWEPPPLRQLLESTPPPPRLPSRPAHELASALRNDDGTYGLTWSAPAFANTATLTIDWDATTVPKPRRAYLGWMAVGAVYALGVAGMIVHERDRQQTMQAAKTALVQARDAADRPAASTPNIAQRVPAATVEPTGKIEQMAPLHIVGYVTDPPPPTAYPPTRGIRPAQLAVPNPSSTAADEPTSEPAVQEIDLARLRVIVGAKAAQAAGCGDGEHHGSSRVAITFAPSGRATSAVLTGGRFAGTRVGSCIASVMRSARIPAFKGSHTTVTKRVTIRQ